MTQSQKDLTLSSAAVADNNNYVGVQCLAWVQAVVPRASGGVVNIPTFMDWPYEYQLKAPNTAHVVNRNVTDIKNVQLMDIVQMYWYPRAAKGKIRAWDPHTAFVLRKTATSMDFLDCNFVGTDIVGVHTVTFADFVSFTDKTLNSGAGFTVYHVQ